MKKINILAIILIALSFVITLVYTIFSFWPYNIIELKSVKLLTPTVKAGEEVKYRVNFCKYLDVPSSNYRQIKREDGIVILTTERISGVAPGCYTDFEIVLPIPQNAFPGKYHVEITSDYQVNFIRKVTLEFKYPQFIIEATP